MTETIETPAAELVGLTAAIYHQDRSTGEDVDANTVTAELVCGLLGFGYEFDGVGHLVYVPHIIEMAIQSYGSLECTVQIPEHPLYHVSFEAFDDFSNTDEVEADDTSFKLVGLTDSQIHELKLADGVTVLDNTASTAVVAGTPAAVLELMVAYKTAMMNSTHPSIAAAVQRNAERCAAEGYHHNERAFVKSFRLSHMTATSSVIRKLTKMVSSD